MAKTRVQVRCPNCGQRPCKAKNSLCDGMAWFANEDGRPPGTHPALWEAYQAGKYKRPLFSLPSSVDVSYWAGGQ